MVTTTMTLTTVIQKPNKTNTVTWQQGDLLILCGSGDSNLLQQHPVAAVKFLSGQSYNPKHHSTQVL